jgi:hypothetical protein
MGPRPDMDTVVAERNFMSVLEIETCPCISKPFNILLR